MSSATKATPILYELLWWAFTLVLAGLVLLPIYSKIPNFEFYLANFIYVVVAITLTRYLFFLKISWLRDHLLIQGALSLLLIPLIFWMGQYINYFITSFDENGPDFLVKHLPKNIAGVINGYLKAEYRFFGIWAIIAALLTPIRLLYNVWIRYRAGVRKL